MAPGINPRVFKLGLAIGTFLLATHSVIAQKVIVDAAPSQVVNTFSPPHSLGAAIDRLRQVSP